MKKVLVLCTTDSMIWNFLIPHIREMEKMGLNVECACARTGFYFDELKEQYGLTVHEIPFTRSPISVRNIRGFRSLCGLIRTRQFDRIFCHEPVGGMMGRLAGKVCGRKVVYMAHGFHFFTGAPARHWAFYYTAEYILSFFTEALITINREDYKRACKMHARRNYYVHGIGVQPQKLAYVLVIVNYQYLLILHFCIPLSLWHHGLRTSYNIVLYRNFILYSRFSFIR